MTAEFLKNSDWKNCWLSKCYLWPPFLFAEYFLWYFQPFRSEFCQCSRWQQNSSRIPTGIMLYLWPLIYFDVFYHWYFQLFWSEFCQSSRWLQNSLRIPTGNVGEYQSAICDILSILMYSIFGIFNFSDQNFVRLQ